MKNFVLFFRMDITTPGAQPSPEQMQEYRTQWMTWVNSISDKGQLEGGNHLSPQGRVLQHQEQFETPYISESNSVAGYLLISAKDLEEATQIAKACPILNGQTTSVEIREIATPG